MTGEAELLLAAHPPLSSWLLHPLLQRGPMMVHPPSPPPSTSTNPIPASPSAKQNAGVACCVQAVTYWGARTSVYMVLEKTVQ